MRPESPAAGARLDDLLTPAAAARNLGICVKTLRRHVKAGEISYILVGRGLQRQRRMFDPADLKAFRERRRRTEACPSTRAPMATMSTISDLKVYGFTARLAASRGAMPKNTNDGGVRKHGKP